jgi:hypothetical protein
MLEAMAREFVVCGRFMLEIVIAPIKLPTIKPINIRIRIPKIKG